MHKIKLLCFLSMAILPLITVQAQKVESVWASAPLNIDGKKNDWGQMPGMFNAATSMFYEVRNNKDMLYLIFEFMDQQSIRKFMKAGFEITIMAKTKPKLQATLTLPTLQHNKNKQAGLHGSSGDMTKMYLLTATESTVEGFLKTSGTILINNNNPADFTYHIGWSDDNTLVVEVQIPISELCADTDSFEKFISKPLKIKASLKAFEKGKKNEMNGNNDLFANERQGHGAGYGHPGSRQPGMNGMQGAGSRRPAQSANEMAGVQSVNMKVLLSNK